MTNEAATPQNRAKMPIAYNSHLYYSVTIKDFLLNPASHIVINKLQLGIAIDSLNHPVFIVPGICPIAIGQHIAVIIISGLIGVDNRVLVQHIGCIVMD